MIKADKQYVYFLYQFFYTQIPIHTFILKESNAVS